MRLKQYNNTAALYAEKLRSAGYSVKFNFVDSWNYEDVSVCGPLWRGYGTEFSTPRKAYEYIMHHAR